MRDMAQTALAPLVSPLLSSGPADPPAAEAPAHDPVEPAVADDPGPQHRRTAARDAAACMFAGLYDGPAAFDANDPGGPLSKADVDKLVATGGFLAQQTRFYHATRTRNLGGPDGILEDGLQPRFGGTGAAAGNDNFEATSRGKVHVTRDEDHAHDYKTYYETGVMPTNPDLTTQDRSPGEVLKVSLPRALKDQLRPDKDDPLARTLDVAIPPEHIKPSSPAPHPGPREPGREAEYQDAFLAHQARGEAENAALASNMSAEQRAILEKFPPEKRGPAMQMIKQGLMAADNPLKDGKKVLP